MSTAAAVLSRFQSAFPGLYALESAAEDSASTSAQAVVAPSPPVKVTKASLATAKGGKAAAAAVLAAEAAAAAEADAQAALAAAAEAERRREEQENSLYIQRKASITEKFEKSRSTTDELQQYLLTKEAEAKQAEAAALIRADEEFTPAWRNTGLPMRPSHLSLDGITMASGRLVNPKAIMEQYQQVKAKEVLQPPRVFEYNDTTADPNYLKTTNAQMARTGMLSPAKLTAIHEASMKARTWAALTEAEVTARLADSDARHRQLATKMPAVQYELEKKVIQRVHEKLTFLRNPRHALPPAVQLLQSQYTEPQRWDAREALTMKPKVPPIKSDMTAKPDECFVVEPADIIFTNYAAGQVYERHVRFRNVTGVLRGLRVFPPASQYFHASLPRFPNEAGVVAPGCHAELTLRFCPDSLADYDDSLTLDTASRRITVPLRARRPPPALTLPHENDAGEVVIGNCKVVTVLFKNLGGDGRFRVVPADLWPDCATDAPDDVARVGCFEVSPARLDVPAGIATTLTVAFAPDVAGEHKQRLVLVCDNCQVQDFYVLGTASHVDVELVSVDARALLPRDLELPLWFGEVVPGSGFARRLNVRNASSLPYPFEWHMSTQPHGQPARVDNAVTLDVAPQGLAAGVLWEGASAGAASGGHVRAPSTKDALDLVELGLDPCELFHIEPAEGTLQPGETLEFVVTLVPLKQGRVLRWARLMVDKTVPGQPPHGCDTKVLDVGLEGVGVPVPLTLAPALISIAGLLMPNEVVQRTVVLDNGSRAPARFHFEGMSEALELHPSIGVVEPLSSLAVTATLRALPAAGAMEHRLVCHVMHGQSIPMQVTAKVGYPWVEALTHRLDFGLIRLSATCTQPLRIRNVSTTCPSTWSVRELLSDGRPAAEGRQGAEDTAAAAAAAISSAAGGAGDESGPAGISCGTGGGGANPSREASGGGGLGHESSGAGGPIGRTRSGVPHSSGGAAVPASQLVTHLTFYPEDGVLGPGEELDIEVACHAASDGQHRSIVEVMSDGAHRECVEAFACAVTPHCVINRLKTDLGVTFVGVSVKKTLLMRNLSLLPADYKWRFESLEEDPLADMKIRADKGTLLPGDEVDVVVRYTPRTSGSSTMFALCDIAGAAQPIAFQMTSTVQGLAVGYELLTAEQFERYQADVEAMALEGRQRATADVDNFVGMNHLPPDVAARVASHREASMAARHLEASFGQAVPLSETRQLYLIVTNHTAIHTSVSTCLDMFGLEDTAAQAMAAGKPLGGRVSVSAAGTLHGNTGGGRQSAGGATSNFGGSTVEGGTSQRIRTSKYTPIRLGDEAEKTKPFRSTAGNDMMAARRQQIEAEMALNGKGLAISVHPPESTLEPWSRLVLCISAFNDMCGDYFDTLHVRVGDLPSKDIPMRIGVTGTPLVVQKERVLVKGLHGRSWKTALEFGALPGGVVQERPFYVFNTGSLDMHLAWVFQRYMDESDTSNPLAQICDVKLHVFEEGEDDDRLLSTSQRHLSGAPEGSAPTAAPSTPEGAAGAATAGGPPGEAAPTAIVAEGNGTKRPGRVALSMSRHAAPDVAPYVVSPAETVIPGGQSAKFVVTFSSGRSSHHEGYLVGRQQVASPEAPVSLNLWPTGTDGEGVGVLMTGTFHPYAGAPPVPLQPLQVDLHTHAIVSSLELDANSELSWTCHSVAPPASHPSFCHTVTLTNVQRCPLAFSLATQGPFELLTATPSLPQDPAAFMGTPALPLSLAGRIFLPPRESVDATLVFRPPPPQEGSQRDAQPEDYSLAGSLVLTYSNGDVQVLPLDAKMLHPTVEVTPTSLSFGNVHPHAPKPLLVTVSNPTLVDAAWAVTTEGRKPAFLCADALAAAGTEACFGPWVVSPASGLLGGRGLRLPKTQSITVTYMPVGAEVQFEKLVFAVRRGRSVALAVDGSGSFDEATEHKAKLFGI